MSPLKDAVDLKDTQPKKPGPKRSGTVLGFAALGVALATTVLWFRAARLVEIPANRIVYIAFFLIAMALGVAAFVRRTRWFGAIPAVLGILVGGFLVFTMAISRQEVATTGIQVGETIPAFRALDRQGQWFESASLDGRPTLIKFFRGHW